MPSPPVPRGLTFMNATLRKRPGKRSLLAAILLTMIATVSSAPAETLSLDQCMERALRNSPELAQAEQRIFSAEAGVLGAYGSFLPDLSTSFGYNHQFVGPKPASTQYNTITQEFFTQDPIASRDYESYGFGINSSLTLFSGFSRWTGLKSSKLSLAATRLDAEQTRHGVESAVIQTYYDLVKAQMLVELNGSSREAAREQYEQSKRAFSMGAVARSDTLRTSVRYAETRLDLLEAENSLELARLNLGTVIGMDSGRGISVESVREASFVQVDGDEALRAALSSHPELRAADLRRDAAEYDLRTAKAGLWPSVSASYRYGWSDLSPPEGIDHLFDTDYTYTLSLGMNWDLFDSFRTKRGINQSRANARIQSYNMEQQRRRITRDVELTLVTLQNARKRIELAAATIALAEEDLRLARERYRVGAATLLEVTEAEVSQVRGRVSQIEGLTNYLSALAELERVTGIRYRN